MNGARKRRPSRLDRLRARVAGAPPGPRQPDRRRAALIEAAGALFVEKGVEATTVEEIAARAGLAKGTVYHYFATKTELLDALRDRFATDFHSRLIDAVATCDPDDWAGKLRAWLREAVTAYFDMHALHDVVFHGSERPVREAMGDIALVQHLALLLRDGDAAGAWQVPRPREVAVILFHGLHGAADEAMLDGRPAEDVRALLVSLYERMIGVQG
ncbi:TetR/AcrR family transcriptional regulator [Flavisphingomonas formosensis]|uniref:TetR/AcrR family transcriptional regulator n=1 Tax=Flavisphingomonas formosensis TaxID=861534 RepID=UPI0012FA3217|nr:TetR/AcrR family transcriptional regulator [Sphingomonas formosensis]